MLFAPTVLPAYEATTKPQPVSVGGQLTVVGGWDSAPIPGAASSGAAFTGLEAFGTLRVRERGDELHELKVLGRAFVYPTLSDAGSNARASLLWSSMVRIHARARFTFSLLSSLGSTRASRGTDGTPTAFDALSSQRVDGATRATIGFVHELTPTLRLGETIGFGLTTTLSDRLVGTGISRSPGIDSLGTDVSASLTQRAGTRTTWEYGLRLDRTRLLDLVDATGRAPHAADPVDLATGTATVRLAFLTTPTLSNWARVGATLLTTTPSTPTSAATSGTSAVPTATLGVSARSDASSFMAEAGFAYSVIDPRLGPGAGATAVVTWMGRPLRSVRGAEILLAGNGARTSILGGPNQGAAFVSMNGSAQLRVALAGGIAAVGGVELRYSRLDVGTVFSREVVFLGLSTAWWSDVRAPSLATLAAPVQPGF